MPGPAVVRQQLGQGHPYKAGTGPERPIVKQEGYKSPFPSIAPH